MNTINLSARAAVHIKQANHSDSQSRLVRMFQSGFAKAQPNEVVFLAHAVELKSSVELLSKALTKKHLYAWPATQLALFSFIGGVLFAVKMLLAPLFLLLPILPADRYLVTNKLGKRVMVRTWLVPHFVMEYTWRWMHPIINWKIRQAIKRAAKLGIQVVCLGAGNKSGINNAGQQILDAVRDELPAGMKLMHGDNLTSMVVGHRLLQVVRPGDKIMVLGAGKIVRPHLVTLAKRGHFIKVLTSQVKLVNELRHLVGEEKAHLIQHVRSLQDGQDCRVWTNANFAKGRHGLDLVKKLPENVIVLDYCVPNVLTKRDLATRPDVTYIEAGNILLSETATSTRMCSMRLSPDGYYSCNAALISAMLTGGLSEHEIGPELSPKEIEAWGKRMHKAGAFRLEPHAFGELVRVPA
jgi:hypothetical protein